MPQIHPLVTSHGLISDQVSPQEVSIILRELEQVLSGNIPGDIVELGCYTGTTALYLERLRSSRAPSKTLHVYDSFAGLPEKSALDQSAAGEQFKAGELTAKRRELEHNFGRAHLKKPTIHTCWFEQLRPDDLPGTIAFAFLDGDFYSSIHASLKVIWPKLAKGSVVIVDDYQSDALPGAQKAVAQWLSGHPARLRTEASLAIIQR